MSELSELQRAILETLPANKHTLAQQCDTTTKGAKSAIKRMRKKGHTIHFDRGAGKYHTPEQEPHRKANSIPKSELKSDLQQGKHLSELIEKYDTIAGEIVECFESLQNDGVNIESRGDSDDPVYYIPHERDRSYTVSQPGETITIALISDTHLGSSAEHLEELHDFYDKCEQRGITDVFHCGDISDGFKVHQGHLNCLKDAAIGWDRLRNYVVENYPKRPGITTHFIEGNHDNKFFNRNQIHFGRLIANRREDLHYLGNAQATVYLDENREIDLELIHPSGGKPYCYTGDTRVLTENCGFVRLDEMQALIQAGIDPTLATFNTDTGELEYQTPSKFTVMPWDGDMIRFNTQCLDLCVTPNHRMVTRKNEHHHGYEDDWKLKRADEMQENYVRQKWDIPVNGSWDGENPERFELKGEHFNANDFECDATDFLRFLGWFVSEGWTSQRGRVTLSQQDKSEIVPAVEATGLNPHVKGEKIISTNKALNEWLQEHVGEGAENKRVPEWVKKQSPERIEIFLQSLYKGDGTVSDGKLQGYTTASQDLAHDVVECLLKTGRVGTINKRERDHPAGFESNGPTYDISTSETTHRELTKEPERIGYDGWVYCPTVENGTLVTMRNGQVAVSGNTTGYRIQTLYRERNMSERPTLAGIGHLHGSMYAETEGVMGLYAGAWKGTTTYGKRKGHQAKIGGWILEITIENERVSEFVPHWIGYEENKSENQFEL